MSELPPGWTWSTIGEVTSYVQRGKSPQYAPRSGLPVVNQRCVRWTGVDPQHLKFIAEAQWSQWGPERTLQDGDVLWNSTGTGTIGRAAIYRPLPGYERVVADSHMTIVRASAKTLPEWVHGWIRSPVVQGQIEEMQTGSTNQVELGRTQILNTAIPVPAISEQRRIVNKLRELLDRSSRARISLDAIPPLLEKLRQSILAAALRGDLTAEWRKKNPDVEPADKLLARIRIERRKKWEEAELAKMKVKGKPATGDRLREKYQEPLPIDLMSLNELPPGWVWTTVEMLVARIESGASFACDERPPLDHEVGMAKVSAVTWGEYDEEESKTCMDSSRINERLFVRDGDFLFSRANTIELVGACVIAKDVRKRIMLSDKLLRFDVVAGLHRWLHLTLRSPWGRREIERLATGNQDGMRNIGQARIKEIRIPLPGT